MPIKDILISGAGPTGLAAALFCTEHGFTPRIIEKHAKPSVYSKALGINARSLTLLESSGVTDRLLQSGHKIHAFNLWLGKKRILHFNISKFRNKYNFMLVHPQSKTEILLAEALESKGVKIDRDTILEHVEIAADHSAIAKVIHTLGNSEVIKTDCLLAADGAHSTIRNSLGIDYIGGNYPEYWYFNDLELETNFSQDEAHVFLLDSGCLFMLYIEDNIWRIGGNVENLIDHLPAGTTPGKSIWSTKFYISHKYISDFNRGPIFFAGDAAHLHSPLGARGMNLGIEDAYVFAELLARDNLKAYAGLRAPVAKRVVKHIQHMTEIPRGRNIVSHAVRKCPLFFEILFPFFIPDMKNWALGLDHNLGV